ncbi:Aste57867_19635 [Aphanomyces stellatus]|uniref:Aste57867_19635 protein n=1 Tax=Aphanomyces stellatus TaxID=120398 RepID=A0A485LCW7_9STRA|nr:hypothetical protein As57867_019570 [Aphanomyces stellatus]VFT96335.1 Aste57867_19635 [Aphanomyces stellatus]
MSKYTVVRMQLTVAVVPLALVAIGGLVGAFLHATAFGIQTPNTPPINHLVGIWFAVFSSVAAIHRLLDPHQNARPRWFLFYWATVALSAIVCCIGYAFVPDSTAAIAWNAVVVVVALTAIPSLRPDMCLGTRRTQSHETLVPTVPQLPRWAAVLCTISKSIHALLYLLLAAGAIVAASTYSYTLEGTHHTVTMRDGRSFTMNINCQGPSSSSNATIWFIADAAHGVTDFYGVQEHLVRAGRRVCTQDNPGFGGSAAALGDQQDYTEFYNSMFQADGTGGPIVLVGWGGGGTSVLKYAVDQPAVHVAAVVFLEVHADGIEFLDYQNATGSTDAQTRQHRDDDYAMRLRLARLVLGVAIPLPLMPLFAPVSGVASTYEPPIRAAEFAVQVWKSRFWMAQYAGLLGLQRANESTGVLSTYKLGPTTPLAHVTCRKTDAQSCLHTTNCTESLRKDRFYASHLAAMTTRIQANAMFVFNDDDDCDLRLPVTKPAFTATAIASFLQAIGV